MVKCKVPGCKKPMKVKKHGLCNAHMMRVIRTGSVNLTKKVRKYVKIDPYVISK